MDTFHTQKRILVGIMEKRTKRRFSADFKSEVVRLVLDGGRSATDVARDHDLGPSLVAGWVKQARVDRGQGTPGQLTSCERDELNAARKTNRELRREVEFLKKRAVNSTRRRSLVRESKSMKFAAINRQSMFELRTKQAIASTVGRGFTENSSHLESWPKDIV